MRSFQKAKEDLLRHFKRASRPTLVGQASLLLGHLWSLRETEAVLEELVSEGVIRPVTDDEMYRFDVRHGYFLV